MAQPPPMQRPLQVRAQDVLANVQAAPAVPVPQQGPQAVPAVPAHVAAPDKGQWLMQTMRTKTRHLLQLLNLRSG